MKKITHPHHACQVCGSLSKLVETIIDDEFIWDDNDKQYIPIGYTNDLEHTGVERCTACLSLWTGE